MKRYNLTPALALMIAILAGSCDHMPSGGFLDQVQQAVVRKCSFLPSIKMLITLLNAHSNWTNAAEIADRICAVVAQPTPRGLTPMIENVPLDGIAVTPRQ